MLTLLIAAAALSAVYWIIFIIGWITGKLKAAVKVHGLITAVILLGTCCWLSYWNLLGYKF
jgi:hypothetical protein